MEYIIVGILVLLLFFIPLYFYNKLISSKQNVKEAWSGIDIQLNRRHDLIPNLVRVVKQYTKHEDELFKHVTEERSKALSVSPSDTSGLSVVEKELDKSVRSLIAVAENYPDLKANENFLKLQTELSETEDQIASSRRIYNSNVADYNTLVGIFPANIIASMNNFQPAPFFQK